MEDKPLEKRGEKVTKCINNLVACETVITRGQIRMIEHETTEKDLQIDSLSMNMIWNRLL